MAQYFTITIQNTMALNLQQSISERELTQIYKATSSFVSYREFRRLVEFLLEITFYGQISVGSIVENPEFHRELSVQPFATTLPPHPPQPKGSKA